MTLIECVSATGKRLPAFYIYAGAAHYAGWHQEDSIDAQTVFAYTDNGWTKDYVGLEFLKNHFDKYAIPSKSGAVRLLLCDNHSSHDTYEFKKYCIEHNIALFYFPSHATHLLQPLDVGVFGPLDRYCSQEVDIWTASQPLATPLRKADFLPMCEQARKKGVTEHNIRKAWAERGIHPFNQTRILKNPKYPLLFRAHPESPPPREGLRQHPFRPPPPPTAVQAMAAKVPSTIEEG